jgi:nitrate/TMAO reductase-like tetraheme cytochrome c subunit
VVQKRKQDRGYKLESNGIKRQKERVNSKRKRMKEQKKTGTEKCRECHRVRKGKQEN